jgi:hypothetical protein
MRAIERGGCRPVRSPWGHRHGWFARSYTPLQGVSALLWCGDLVIVDPWAARGSCLLLGVLFMSGCIMSVVCAHGW